MDENQHVKKQRPAACLDMTGTLNDHRHHNQATLDDDDDEKDITNNEMFDIEAQEQQQEPSRRASQVRFVMDTKPTKRTSM